VVPPLARSREGTAGPRRVPVDGQPPLGLMPVPEPRPAARHASRRRHPRTQGTVGDGCRDAIMNPRRQNSPNPLPTTRIRCASERIRTPHLLIRNGPRPQSSAPVCRCRSAPCSFRGRPRGSTQVCALGTISHPNGYAGEAARSWSVPVRLCKRELKPRPGTRDHSTRRGLDAGIVHVYRRP